MNGFLMHRDTVVAEICDNNIKVVEETFLPLYLKRNGSIITWIENRAIDRHRPHSRILKRILRLKDKSDLATAMRFNAATITDNYWIQKSGENLSYCDVRFSENYFDDLALKADPDSLEKLANIDVNQSRTPELTNIGSYEKCWKLEDGRWWLYKNANKFEQFSELFIASMGHSMGFNMATYQPWAHGTKSLDFTENGRYDFVLAEELVGDDEDYITNYRAISEWHPEFLDDYLDIIVCDAIFFNMDRHTKNYGFLRNASTGAYAGMAPNFDNNIALISRGYPSEKGMSRKNDLFINDFLDLLEAESVDYTLPVLDANQLSDTLKRMTVNSAIDMEIVKQFVLNGYERLEREIPQREILNGIDESR